MSNRSSQAWPLVRFGDVVRNVNDNVRDPLTSDLERYVGLEHLDPESLHIKRWGLIADGTTFTRFQPGQVLFGSRRAYQRKVAVAEFDGICSGDMLGASSRPTINCCPNCCPSSCSRTDSLSTPSARLPDRYPDARSGRTWPATNSPCRRWTNSAASPRYCGRRMRLVSTKSSRLLYELVRRLTEVRQWNQEFPESCICCLIHSI